jgi:hypothetical protein
VLRIAARLATIVLLLCAGCGGGGGSSDPAHEGVDAFPDVLEIARAELGDDVALYEVTLSEGEIAFVHAQLGRNVRVKYNDRAVFTGNEPVRKRLHPRGIFQISAVPADAPAKLLAAIQERESGDVTAFGATLARDRSGTLVWKATATVNGAAKRWEAELDGSLRG